MQLSVTGAVGIRAAPQLCFWAALPGEPHRGSAVNVGQSNTLSHASTHTSHTQVMLYMYYVLQCAAFILSVCLYSQVLSVVVRRTTKPIRRGGEGQASRAERERCRGRAGMRAWLSCCSCCYCRTKQRPSKSHKTVSHSGVGCE